MTKAILTIKEIFLRFLSTEYCSPGWEYFQGSCYSFSSTSKSWSDSQTHCQQSSADLVNIGSMQENDFINAHLNTDRWIGLREVPGNKMNWTDDSTEPVYVNWQAAEPVYEDDQDDCAYFSVSSGTWHTKLCDEVLHFVCEKGKTLSSKGTLMCLIRHVSFVEKPPSVVLSC